MRTIYQVDNERSVTITYECPFTDAQITRTFWRPLGGGYVFEFRRDGNDRQVCDGLARTGNTLICNSDEPLVDLIRREFRRMRRREARSMQQFRSGQSNGRWT